MADGEVKINLGCGPATLPGFDNIDNSPSVFLARHPLLKKLLYKLRVISKQHYETPWPRDIIWRDASRRLPYADDAVDKLYSSHFLEHLKRDKAVAVLEECRRVLKPGGIFRLVVPDLHYHARRYVEETDALLAADSAERETLDRFMYTVSGGYTHRRRSAHYYMYDWPTFKLLLTKLGFVNVEQKGYQQSADPELAALDNRPDESLHVEMTVPER